MFPDIVPASGTIRANMAAGEDWHAGGRSMIQIADRTIALVLLAVHAGLVVWSLAGFAEWFGLSAPWPSLMNPLFPSGLLFVHFLAIGLGGSVFLLGYARGWGRLPEAMAGCYGFMAAVCAVETFGYLEHASRFANMAVEYVTYLVIILYLYYSPGLRRHRGDPVTARPGRAG